MEYWKQKETFKNTLLSYDAERKIYCRKRLLAQSKFELSTTYQIDKMRPLSDVIEAKKNFHKNLPIMDLEFYERIQFNYAFKFKVNGVIRTKKVITAMIVDIDDCALSKQQLRQKADDLQATVIIHSDTKAHSKQIIFQLDQPLIYDADASKNRGMCNKIYVIQHFLNIQFNGDPLFTSHIGKNPLCHKTWNNDIICCDHNAEWLCNTPIQFDDLLKQSVFFRKRIESTAGAGIYLYLVHLAENKNKNKSKTKSKNNKMDKMDEIPIIVDSAHLSNLHSNDSKKITTDPHSKKINDHSQIKINSEGRNQRTFDFLRSHAYRFRNSHTLNEIMDDLPNYLYQLLAEHPEIPADLPQHEINDTIQSIHQYCIRSKTHFLNHHPTNEHKIPEWIVRFNQKREQRKQNTIDILLETLGIDFLLKRITAEDKKEIAELCQISLKTLQRYLAQIRQQHQSNPEVLSPYEKIYVLRILLKKKWQEIHEILHLHESIKNVRNGFYKWKKKYLDRHQEEKLEDWLKNHPNPFIENSDSTSE
ncbi:hypothetical protein [Wielerella bovis]|uniref:hypothetical protein n=1 Tax=Wielerella bovis TaxID=2917790 RepID=UPI002018D262|nr:hypothetical protein [Wielerella bovis]ULJ59504.1 hypothetical protein MIS44_07285 [Wielerella bovis]